MKDTILRQVSRAKGAQEAIRAVPGLRSELRFLKDENKKLRAQLKERPPQVATLQEPASDDRELVVERFHQLYRDGLRLDKQTWWRGARVIKCPLDLWVYQEMIFELEPDLIIETGTMYGGSAYYLASILDMLGKGEIVTIDKNLREGRPEHPRITYLTGSSSSKEMIGEATARAAGKGTVIVVLDSNHKADHVLAELRAYHELVTPGSYIVVEDTNINGHPVEPTFGPGPMEALQVFLEENDDFDVDRGREKFLLSFNPHGFLRKK
jgi:cephalosporin hydroxylase